MTATCARCGDADADRKLYPPLEWVEYLRTERGLSPPEGVLAVPLCGDCRPRLALLRRGFREFDDLDADERLVTSARIEAALDALDLEALLDETGPVPDDVEEVL